MHAIQQREFGPADTLRYEELPDPAPGEGEVQIAVEASGVHFIDTKIRAGDPEQAPQPLPQLPMIPGREVAGTIAAVGPDVHTRWIGRRVVAHLGLASGGYAERAVAPTRALHMLPDHVAAGAAVAMIGTGRTAMAVLDVARPSSNDVVLVMSAAGGLGSLLVQGAKSAGATVVGAAGGATKVGRVEELGADVAVDYDEPGWDDEVRSRLAGRDVTLVLDGVGGDRGRQALELLGVGGRLILYGGSSGTWTQVTTGDLYRKSLTVSSGIGPRITSGPGGIRHLESKALAALANGTLTPLVGSPFPLADAAAAHVAIETRKAVGKTVLVP